VSDDPRVRPRTSADGGVDLWPPLIFAVHAVLFVALAAWTWRKWPDPLVDFGRELYVPWQLTRGRVLYRDIFSLFGPLSPYVNAAWFRLFGVSLTTLVLCNLAIFAGVLAAVYRFVRLIADRVTAATASLTTLLLFGFAHLVEIGNYNFAAPYSHEATHGLAIGLLLMLCLARGVARHDRASWALSGICLGLIALTKPEIAVAAMAATAIAVAGAFQINLEHRRRIVTNAALLVACATIPSILFYVYFLGRMTSPQAALATAGAWAPLLRGHVATSMFYLRGMGLDHPAANATRMLLTFVAFALMVVVAAAVSRERSGTGSSSLLQRLQQVALLIVAVGFGQTGLVFYALPLMVLATLLWASVLFYRARFDRSRATPVLWLVVWSTFALALLAKMGLNTRIVHYGFYLSLPATVLTIVLIAWLLPRAYESWQGARAARTFRAILLIAFAGAIAPYLAISVTRYRDKVVPIGSGGDLFYASRPPEFWQGEALQETLSQLDRISGSTIAVMPEGVMVNYLTRRESPLRVVNLMPPELMTFGEDEIVRSLEAAPPDLILLVHIDMREYGYPAFGSDRRYGERTIRWVRAHYTEVRVVGTEPLSPAGFGLVLLKRLP